MGGHEGTGLGVGVKKSVLNLHYKVHNQERCHKFPTKYRRKCFDVSHVVHCTLQYLVEQTAGPVQHHDF